MTILASIKRIPHLILVSIQFTCETSRESIVKTLELHGHYRNSANGVIYTPNITGKWLIILCDEVNISRVDKFGTQQGISFMRQFIEQGGFWRSDGVWIQADSVILIGTCKTPMDTGRVTLPSRFLRNCLVLNIDYPEADSLSAIYEAYTHAMLRFQPSLQVYSSPLAQSMIALYRLCKSRFTVRAQPHYTFSPRDLTRWIRGIFEIVSNTISIDIGVLLRIWANESIRLFQDRLVHLEEKKWAELQMNSVILEYFPTIDIELSVAMPIFFSRYLTQNYESCNRKELSMFIQEKLDIFCAEECIDHVVLFDTSLDHIQRIDRVLRQNQGHMLLVGLSGSGRSTMTRFAAWMNGMSIFRPLMHSNYCIADFELDLRTVLKRAGANAEKIVFIIDASNSVNSSFLEKINTLLTQAEIPGLFEVDDMESLMILCRAASNRDGVTEVYTWFLQQVAKNLHIVYITNPPINKKNNLYTACPALLNRCVINWIGSWDDQALHQVAKKLTQSINLTNMPASPQTMFANTATIQDTILDLFSVVHKRATGLNESICLKFGFNAYIGPKHFVDLIYSFVKIYINKRCQLENRQKNIMAGLQKLYQTTNDIKSLQITLSQKDSELKAKSQEANQKLKTMFEEQKEAENNKCVSKQNQNSLNEKNIAILERKAIASDKLANAEPAIIEAQQSVRNIKKIHLTELRSMANPPSAVKLAMESVCIILGFCISSWKDVQAILRRDGFITSIIDFDTSTISPSRSIRLEEKYLSDPSYNFETVNRASRACGPLVKWVMAQVSYARILEKIEPLKEELINLELGVQTIKSECSKNQYFLIELEQSICRYKEEYSHLICEINSIKMEMESVKNRVNRSMQILKSISCEQGRWEKSKDLFGTESQTLVGDSMLVSAHLTYGGIFDQQSRQYLLEIWKSCFVEAKINFNPSISIVGYLSTDEERSLWLSNSLPSGSMSMEIALLVANCRGVVLIVDPSGQALNYSQNLNKSRGLIVTSFKDALCLKKLESSLQFGNPIVITDAEFCDPAIYSVLKKDIRKSDGRFIIKLDRKL